ncbi:MAG: S8 family serine peptidase [Cyanobacteria bacterium SBC]|nr:S8 family serine peptidase [Cyanobacteria bacterium SBC]
MVTHNFENLEGFVEYTENFTDTELRDRYRFAFTETGQLNLGFSNVEAAIDWTLETEAGEFIDEGSLTLSSATEFDIPDLAAGSYDLVFSAAEASDYGFSLEPEYDAITGLEISSGYFTVEDENITVDYLIDGGKYEGQVGIFSLEGLEEFETGSPEWVKEVARRSMSDSTLGHIIIDDRTDAARIDAAFDWETDVENSGTYAGRNTFSMNVGDRMGIILVPDGLIQEVFENPEIGGSKRPLFSLASANPNEMFHIGQIADAGNEVYILEDWRADTNSDKDYNDIAFRLEGVRGEGIHKVEDLIDDDYKAWTEEIDLETAPQILHSDLVEDSLTADDSLTLNLTVSDSEGIEDVAKIEISIADDTGSIVKTLEIVDPTFENIEENQGDLVWNYDISELESGNYTVSVRAEDQTGDTSEVAEVSFDLNPDSGGIEPDPGEPEDPENHAPKWVELQLDSSRVEGDRILDLSGLVSDVDGVDDLQSVTLVLESADGEEIDRVVVEAMTEEGDDRSSFNLEYDVSGLADGEYRIRSIVTDEAGEESIAPIQTFEIGEDDDEDPETNTPPEDLVFSILPVYTTGEVLNFDRARVFDADGIDDLNRVDFWLENRQGQRIEIIEEDVTEFSIDSQGRARFNFEYDLENLAPDRYTLKAIAYDNSNASSNLEFKSFSLISDLGGGETLSDPVRLAIGVSTDLDSYTAAEIEDTANWIVWLTPGTDATALAESLDATNLGESGFIPNTYIWDFDDELSAEEITAAIANTPTVEVAYPDVPIPLRLLGRDPDYLEEYQWSLHQPIDPSDPNSNIIGVWEHPTLRYPTGEFLSGEGVVVAFVDDGLKYDHIEFNPATGGHYRPDLSWDYTDDDNDPFPQSIESFNVDLKIDDFSKDSFTFDIPVTLTGVVVDVDVHFENTSLTPDELKALQDIAIELVSPEDSIDIPGDWFSLRNYSWYFPGWNDLNFAASDFIQENNPGELSLMLADGFDRSFAGGTWKLHFYNDTYGPIPETWKSVVEKLGSCSIEITTINPHGTAVAGIVADEDGDKGTRGIAANADIAALRLIGNIDAIDYDYDIYGSTIAQTLYDDRRNAEIDIFNNSWGAFPFVHQPLATAALESGAKYGLDGLGNSYIFSAGNDRSRDIGSGLGYAQVNNYALTNSRHSIAVGAVTFKGEAGEIEIVRAPYSNPGAFVSAYSNNGLDGNPNGTDIVTTGVNVTSRGRDTYVGYPAGKTGFGGTSAAAPFVSGVVALMREVNPNLTNRDIQHILAETSYKVDPDHHPDEVDPDYNRTESGWTTNGAGYDINYQYGFGAVNPKAAVELAAEWTTVTPEIRVETKFRNVNDDLPNGGTVGLSDSVEVESDITLEWVEVIADFAHEDWNDLTVILTSPDGTETILRHSVPDLDTSGVEIPPLAPEDPFHKGYWTFTTSRFWGESSEGEWTLQVLDEKGNDISGEWNGWKLNLYGTEPDLPDSPSLFVEPTKRWTAQNGTPYWEKASDIAVDTEGNSYIVGFTPGDLNGNINAGNNGEHAHGDAYISKFDAKGDLVWTQLLGGTEGDSFNQIELGKDGNLYVTGTTYSSLAGTHQGSKDALFVKYDPDGNLIWSHQFGTSQEDHLDGIVTDLDGNLYTVGYTAGELFDSPSANANGYDSIVIKWDTSGNQIWAKQMDFPSHVPMDVGFNAAENRLEMAGWIHGAFPGQTHEGYLDGFVASIDTDGNIIRTLQLGTSDRDAIHGIDIDRHGNIAVHGVTWGAFPGQTQFGEGDIFAAKYDSDGELLWTRQFGTSEYDYGTYGDVQIDIFGNVLLSGTQSETTGSRFDGLVTAFNPQGERIDWTEQLDTSTWDGMGNIVLTNNSLYALGRSHTSVDGQPYSGSMDVVIRKYDWKQIYTPGASLDINDVHASAPAGNPMTAILSLSDKDAGILSSNTSNSASIEFSDGVFRVTGSVEAVNAVLDDVQYTPSDGYTGDFIINTAVTDALGRTRLGRTLFLEATPPTTVNLEALDTEAHEDGDAAVFAVTREENLDKTLVVNYQIGGTANRDSDYQPLAGSVTLEPGQKGATISVVPNYDLLGEGDETVEITLTSGSDYILGSDINGTATIADSSTISRYGSFIYENPDTGNLYIVTERDTWYGAQAQAEALGGNLVTINDQAEQDWLIDTFGANEILWIGFTDNPVYGGSSGEFIWVNGEPVTYTNWHPSEPNNLGEEDSVHLHQDMGNFPNQGKWNDRPGSHILHGIAEIDPNQLDNPIVTMMVTDAKAGENGNAGQIVIQRFDDLSQDLTLDLTVSGSATPGADYEALPNQVTIPAGEKLITVPIHAIFDGRVESPETAIVEIQPGDYTLASQAIGQITIDDSATPFNPTVYTHPDTGNRYVLSQFDTWLGAQEQAEALGGRLVTIENEAENQWLIDTFGTIDAWIGFTDSPIYNAREGDFQWVGGEAVSYTNWLARTEEPNNVKNGVFEGEDFTHFRDNEFWSDLYISELPGWSPRQGIIEIPNDSGSLPYVNKDWQYSIDSFNDSMAGYDVGGTHYEIYGTALKETSDSIYLAINSNLPLSGVSSAYATDGHVGWGDLLFNFSGNNLDTASANGELFGIRFAELSDSGVSELGVYRNVRATDIAVENGMALWDASLSGYINWITQHGGTPTSADLSATDPYFNLSHHVPNSMVSGTKIGDVEVLNNANLFGLNFGQFGATGSNTMVLKFDRDLLPDGDYVYTLAPECDNDIVAGVGSLG